MKKPLTISDSRMLQLLKWAVDEGLVGHETEYFDKIGFGRSNIGNIRLGNQSFTRDHIFNACTFTGANANWIFGFESNMMRKEQKDPLKRLREATIELEALFHAKQKAKKK